MRKILKNPIFICFVVFCVIGLFTVAAPQQVVTTRDSLGHVKVLKSIPESQVVMTTIASIFRMGVMGAIIGFVIVLIKRIFKKA